MGKLPIGSVVLAQFPFSDLSSKKLRPCLIIGIAEFDDLLLCQITSRNYGSKCAVPFSTKDMQTGSIVVDSFVRPDKVATLDQKMIVRKLGQLKTPKLSQVKALLRKILEIT